MDEDIVTTLKLALEKQSDTKLAIWDTAGQEWFCTPKEASCLCFKLTTWSLSSEYVWFEFISSGSAVL
uniref:Uncharacterized protein n=1 Tax=Neolamprologus brichardi TaxID=32507 RepID=A0A3Q4FXY9_NEOBR